MKLEMKDLYWLAGLLEGEGCFCWSAGRDRYRYPRISLSMTDQDVIVRAQSFFGTCKSTGYTPSARKPYYTIQITGSRAAGWMMTLYSLMGKRRKARIKEILLLWKSKQSITFVVP